MSTAAAQGGEKPALRKPVFVKVDKLKPGTNGHTLTVNVVKADPVPGRARPGAPVSSSRAPRIAECLVGDETGAIVFTARNEQATRSPNRPIPSALGDPSSRWSPSIVSVGPPRRCKGTTPSTSPLLTEEEEQKGRQAEEGRMSGFGDGYVGTTQGAMKMIRWLEKKREAERRKIEEISV